MYGNENTEIQAFWNVRTFGCFYACTSRLWINLPSGRCLCFRTQRASQLRLAAVAYCVKTEVKMLRVCSISSNR